MLQSTRLRAQHTETTGRLQTLATTAGTRLFTPAEQKEFDDLTATADRLNGEIRQHEQREAVLRGTPAPGVRAVVDETGREHAVLRGGPTMERLADRPQARAVSAELAAQFSPAALIRGIVAGQWDRRELLQRAMSEGSLPGGGYTVPAPLSAMWLDMARAASVCSQAGAIVVPMDSQTLRIAGLLTDVVPAFRAENTAFPVSNNTFRAIDLRARTVGCISEASIELWADSPNIGAMVDASMTGAMGVAFDSSLLNGSGNQVAPADDPRGILNWPGIGDTPAVGAISDYLPWNAAMEGIALANHVPATIIDNPTTTYTLAGKPTGISGDKTPLTPPAPYVAAQKLMTTSMPATNSLVGDFTRSGWGMRESITVEATRLTDTALLKGQVQIRVLARLDTFVTYPAAFWKLSAMTMAAAAARK